jgi:hypothetical protein
MRNDLVRSTVEASRNESGHADNLIDEPDNFDKERNLSELSIGLLTTAECLALIHDYVEVVTRFAVIGYMGHL